MAKHKKSSYAEPEAPTKEGYAPSGEDAAAILRIYRHYDTMLDLRNRKWKLLNDRTLKTFWDDSQKRVNAYVLDRATLGKEDWQANVFSPITRNKLKATLAAVAKAPPPIRMRAMNHSGMLSVKRADVMGDLVRSSFSIGQDAEETAFFDAWQCAVDGTVVTYESMVKTKRMVKVISSYDPVTGEIAFDEREEIIEHRPTDVRIPIQDFFPWDFWEKDVQKQPRLIWSEYYDHDAFLDIFGNYEHAEHVPTTGGSRTMADDTALFFRDRWEQRARTSHGDGIVEVLRYYSILEDQYCIIANGVKLFEGPMLWGKIKKFYPFAVTRFEPFADSAFFYGNSIGNVLMGEQDVVNNLYNGMIDKTYRTMVTPMLVGAVNRDAMELEDDIVTGDTRIYLNDISQVKPMPVPAVNDSEVKMLSIVSRGLDTSSTDAVQGGAAGTGVTAREIVIANERANELKGLFFLMLKSLWVQKYRLRTYSMLQFYKQPQRLERMVGKFGSEIIRTFTIPDAQMSTGERGKLLLEVTDDERAIRDAARPLNPFAPKVMQFNRMNVEDEKMRLQGEPSKHMMISSTSLDDWEYEIVVETESLFQAQRSYNLALVNEFQGLVARLYPQVFAPNIETFFTDLAREYGKDPMKYLANMGKQPTIPPLPSQMTGEQAGAGGEGALTPFSNAMLERARQGENRPMAPIPGLGALT